MAIQEKTFLTISMMVLKIAFYIGLSYSICLAGDMSNQVFVKRFPNSINLQSDSTWQKFSYQPTSSNSLRSDVLRSAIGAAIGGIVGIGIGGYLPIMMKGEFNEREFPKKSFYLGSYIGASVFAALSSAAALSLSRKRELPYWKFASYSLLPPMIFVMPLSVYASIHEENELVRATWIAALTSIGISTFWVVFVYRIHPLKKQNDFTIYLGRPYCGYDWKGLSMKKSRLYAGIRIMEIQF